MSSMLARPTGGDLLADGGEQAEVRTLEFRI